MVGSVNGGQLRLIHRLQTHILRHMLIPAKVNHFIKPPTSGTPLLQVSSAGSAVKKYLQMVLSYQRSELPFWI